DAFRRQSASSARWPASLERVMKNLLSALLGRARKSARKSTRKSSRHLDVELLEDRLVPAANLLVSTDGAAPQQLLQEYTSGGTLVRSLAIPPGGPAEDARDLVADSSGNILVYNGTFSPYLSTYSTSGSWSHQTFAGWSTVNNVSYGGIAL